jgi:tRNA(Ile)-lysidine synthase
MKKFRDSLIEKVKATIEAHNMLKGVDKLIIAFSSGPDSVCLLDTLHRLYGKKIDLCLVYVNHGLRSKRILESEENLARKYASKYGCEYKVIKVKIKKKKIGLEAAAREKRYSVLLDYLKKVNAQYIALGHNLDDMLETFFMNLLRGSGARGLRSIPPVRPPFIRPLINLKKTEILKYLKEKKLSYSLDETHVKLNYRRNLLRHKIIPQLMKINPELQETVKREIEILKQDDDYLDGQAGKVYKNVVKRELNYVSLDINKILRYNLSIVKRVLMRVIKELRGDLTGFESKHFEAVIGLTTKGSGKRINLPKGLYAQREYDNILIGIAKPVELTEIPVGTRTKGLTIGRAILRTRTVSRFKLTHKKSNCEVFDLQKIRPPLVVRNRREGDYIETKIGKKKIKKIFGEFKIPLHKRNEIMMLCDQRGILWVLGVARAFRGFITKSTKKMLVVEFEGLD